MDSESEDESPKKEEPQDQRQDPGSSGDAAGPSQPMDVDELPENQDSSESENEDEPDVQQKVFSQTNVVPDIFPVNRPPGRGRGRGRGVGRAGGRGRGARGRGRSSGEANEQAVTKEPDLKEKRKAAQPTSLRKTLPRGNSLLDHRDMPDADENYSENERALTDFFRLHPMLTLDATSDKTLTAAAEMIEESSIKLRELEVVSKTHDDAFLRAAKTQLGERSCVLGDKCICKWLAAMRFGQDCEQEFVMREFLLPSQEKAFRNNGALPATHGKCLLCCRYFTSYIYTLARNDPSFSPQSCISLQAFGNAIEVSDAETEAFTHSNEVETENGYRLDVMLFADEKWAETETARGAVGALAWRPVVRFRHSDYKFVQDSCTSEWSIIQLDMSAKDYRPSTRPDFVQPLSLTA
jgi:hypothetical protein